MRSPTPLARSSFVVPSSRTPARTRVSTCSLVCDSRTTLSTPASVSRWPSVRPAGPAPTMATRVRMAPILIGLLVRPVLERIRRNVAAHRDPLRLGERVDVGGGPAEPRAGTGIADAAERDLCLVAHGLVVDVHDARRDQVGESK